MPVTRWGSLAAKPFHDADEKAALLLPLAGLVAQTALFWWVSTISYPLFHTLAEMFSIVITGAVFTVAWNSRRFMENGYLTLLGIASLFVGGIDLLHTLAYKGVALFPGFDNDLPTQLWIASRALQAVSLLIAPLFFSRRIRALSAMAAYSLATGLLLLSIFVWRVFPPCFVEGRGLTPFKVGAEYAIALVLVVSLVLLAKLGEGLAPGVRRLLALFILATIGAELAFTFYVEVFGLSNMAGHLLKILAYSFLYQALVATGLQKPFGLLLRDLKQSEEAYHRERDLAESLLMEAPVVIALLDAEGKILRYNPVMEELTGLPSDQAAGLDWFQTFVPAPERGSRRNRYQQVIREGKGGGGIDPVITRWGETVLLEIHLKWLSRTGQREACMLVVGLDKTESVLREKEREELIARLEKAIAQVRTLSGMFPICSSCKKVRDDKGYWNQIEEYLRLHSEAQFTYGICPDCAAKVAARLERIKEKR